MVDIPDDVKNNMEIIPVNHVSEVLKHALVHFPEPIEWTEPSTVPVPLRTESDSERIQIAH